MHDNYLFLDTETSGFRKSGGLKQEGQARVCQIAMILADSYGRTLSEFHSLIKPTDWKISSGAEDCHGISQQACEILGLQHESVMQIFFGMASKAKQIVAHNSKFDKGMMDIERAYFGGSMTLSETNASLNPWYCTQENSVNVCCIPPTDKMKAAGRFHYKTPSLAEAYFHFTGKRLEGAHDAMVDTRACKEIFFAMKGVRT